MKSCACSGFTFDHGSGLSNGFPPYNFYFPEKVQLDFFSEFVSNVHDIAKGRAGVKAECGIEIASSEEIFCCEHTSIASIRLTEISEEKLVITVSCDARLKKDEGHVDEHIFLHIPFRVIDQAWQALPENAFFSYQNVAADYEFVTKNIVKKFSESSAAWKDAIFSVGLEEKLMVLIRHYLLVSDDSNPLTILLRSPQPTRGVAKQIENLLRGAIEQ
jgi:hypothetical protein